MSDAKNFERKRRNDAEEIAELLIDKGYTPEAFGNMIYLITHEMIKIENQHKDAGE